MVCGTPSSVITKSLAVRPSMGFPFLSFAITVSTTNWVLVRKMTVPSDAGGCCWPSRSPQTRAHVVIRRIILEPHPHAYLHASHWIRLYGQAELPARHCGIPVLECHVIQKKTGWRGVQRGPGVVGANGAGDAGSVHGREIYRRQRSAGAGIDLGGN